MVYAVVVAVVVMATLHVLVGLVAICVGVASSIQAEVWLAHTVSPIWSGGFFIITGILGYASAKRKTAYMIMCFTAFSIVSLMTAIVSIQLLRLGLVNHTTDGNTYQKEKKDILILVALGDAGTEILICLISSIVSCRMARAAKNELFQKRAGCFHVQIQFDEFAWRRKMDNRTFLSEGLDIGQDLPGVGDSHPDDAYNDDQPPIYGANQHGEVVIPVDGRHTELGQGHANPALVSNDEADWMDLGVAEGHGAAPSHEDTVQIHKSHSDSEISPRDEVGNAQAKYVADDS